MVRKDKGQSESWDQRFGKCYFLAWRWERMCICVFLHIVEHEVEKFGMGFEARAMTENPCSCSRVLVLLERRIWKQNRTISYTALGSHAEAFAKDETIQKIKRPNKCSIISLPILKFQTSKSPMLIQSLLSFTEDSCIASPNFFSTSSTTPLTFLILT